MPPAKIDEELGEIPVIRCSSIIALTYEDGDLTSLRRTCRVEDYAFEDSDSGAGGRCMTAQNTNRLESTGSSTRTTWKPARLLLKASSLVTGMILDNGEVMAAFPNTEENRRRQP